MQEFNQIQEKLKIALDEPRYEHTLGVMYTAGCMAMAFNYDIKKSMLAGLLSVANNDLNKAENGILIIDEIDKKLKEGVNGKEVLDAMLKMMDRMIATKKMSVSLRDLRRNFSANFWNSSFIITPFLKLIYLLYAYSAKESSR